MNTLLDKKQFDIICTRLRQRTSQVVSLTLFEYNTIMTCTKNALFFSRFSIIDKTFPNLRSLILTYIDYDTWCLFKTRFPPLITTFSIYVRYGDKLACEEMTSIVFSELLFLSSSLKCLSVGMGRFIDGNVICRPQNPAVSSSVQYLYLKHLTIDLLSLLAVAPMLRTFEGAFFKL